MYALSSIKLLILAAGCSSILLSLADAHRHRHHRQHHNNSLRRRAPRQWSLETEDEYADLFEESDAELNWSTEQQVMNFIMTAAAAADSMELMSSPFASENQAEDADEVLDIFVMSSSMSKSSSAHANQEEDDMMMELGEDLYLGVPSQMKKASSSLSSESKTSKSAPSATPAVTLNALDQGEHPMPGEPDEYSITAIIVATVAGTLLVCYVAFLVYNLIQDAMQNQDFRRYISISADGPDNDDDQPLVGNGEHVGGSSSRLERAVEDGNDDEDEDEEDGADLESGNGKTSKKSKKDKHGGNGLFSLFQSSSKKSKK